MSSIQIPHQVIHRTERAHEVAFALYIVYRLHGRGIGTRLALVYTGGDVVDFDGDGSHGVTSFPSGADGMISCFHISRKKEDIQIYLNDAEER